MGVFKKLPQLKVFIVEDSAVVVERLIIMLDGLDYLCVVGYADNISEALSGISEKKPDAVILDISLKENAPDANGIDLLVMLRKTDASMLIIMLTNLATPSYIRKCMESGADYFFDKSYDFYKLPETLKQHYNTLINKRS